MLDKDQVADIIERNPKVDPTAVKRGVEAAKKLAEAGIEIGTYRFQPALGGEILKRAQTESRVKRTQQGS